MVEIIGWTGAVLILGSYALLSAGRLEGRSRTFQWLNVIGAACFVVNSGWHGAIPSTSVNVVWAGVGLFTLWQLRVQARRRA